MTDKMEPKGSTSSSLDEHPGGITSDLPNRCDSCGHHRREHALADGTCGCALCVGFIEPKAPAGSSPDDMCTCGHKRRAHVRTHAEERCTRCDAGGGVRVRHAFAPAEPEPAGYCPPACAEGHTYSGSCALRSYGPPPVSPERVAEMQAEDAEPEAPEKDEYPACQFCNNWHALEDYCIHDEPEAPECKDAEGCHRVIPCDPGCAASSRALRAAMAASPPRPPYALTYVTGSGARTRIALPGDAAASVADGALVISHASGVLGIAEVMPYELEQ